MSWCPAFCRLAAMPLPIMPSPINPTRIFSSHRLGATDTIKVSVIVATGSRKLPHPDIASLCV